MAVSFQINLMVIVEAWRPIARAATDDSLHAPPLAEKR